jgi:hypothetical protein
MPIDSGGIEYVDPSNDTIAVGPITTGKRKASVDDDSFTERSRGRSSFMRSSGVTLVAREGVRWLASS